LATTSGVWDAISLMTSGHPRPIILCPPTSKTPRGKRKVSRFTLLGILGVLDVTAYRQKLVVAGREPALCRGNSCWKGPLPYGRARSRIAATLIANRCQMSMPRIRTGISRSATPRASKSALICSKYDTPVDIRYPVASSSTTVRSRRPVESDFIGTTSMPQSILPRAAKMGI
jgi:hypothetical protein